VVELFVGERLFTSNVKIPNKASWGVSAWNFSCFEL
jgi:hypothetical protein